MDENPSLGVQLGWLADHPSMANEPSLDELYVHASPPHLLGLYLKE